MSQLQLPVPKFGISSSKPFRKFKSPLILLMVVNNGRNNYVLYAKPFPAKVVEPNKVKIKGHNFTGVYPSPVLMKMDARKCIILSCLFIKLKDQVFSQVSLIFTVIRNKLLATNSPNSILNDFEEYCTTYLNS